MKMRGKLVFLDTNLLLTATDKSRTGYEDARKVLSLSIRSGVHMCISSQVIREYMVVAARSVELNGLGLNPADAIRNIESFMHRCVILEEIELSITKLLYLVQSYSLKGKKIHDANIAAVMYVHNVSMLISIDASGFSLFPGIEVMTPDVFLQRLL